LPLPDVQTDFPETPQASSYDLNGPWWSDLPDETFMWQQLDPYVAGEFVWAGFDYLGEPYPYSDRNMKEMGLFGNSSRSSYYGIIDLCGIPKDRYYLFRSQWNKEENTVHILPH
jgi:beta-galactosidase